MIVLTHRTTFVCNLEKQTLAIFLCKASESARKWFTGTIGEIGYPLGMVVAAGSQATLKASQSMCLVFHCV